MCLGIPGRVVGPVTSTGLVDVDVDGATRTVDAALVEEHHLGTGEWVLVHMGFVLEVIDADQAAVLQRLAEPR